MKQDRRAKLKSPNVLLNELFADFLELRHGPISQLTQIMVSGGLQFVRILHNASFTVAEFFNQPRNHHFVTCVCDVPRVWTEDMQRLLAIERTSSLLQKEGDLLESFSPLNSGVSRPRQQRCKLNSIHWFIPATQPAGRYVERWS
ncbi:MAG: hypothetical protein ACK49E_01000, partial [Planctomyces sp.]